MEKGTMLTAGDDPREFIVTSSSTAKRDPFKINVSPQMMANVYAHRRFATVGLEGRALAQAMMSAQLPVARTIAPNEHKKTRSHVKPNAAARRAKKIAEGKLVVIDGKLVS